MDIVTVTWLPNRRTDFKYHSFFAQKYFAIRSKIFSLSQNLIAYVESRVLFVFSSNAGEVSLEANETSEIIFVDALFSFSLTSTK